MTFEQWHNASRNEHRAEYMLGVEQFDWRAYEDWLKEKYQAEHTTADPNGAL